MLRYTIKLHPDKKQGGCWVTVPALAGCYSQVDTLEDAIRNAREAIAGHIATLRELGQPIPEEPAEDEGTQTLTVEVAA